jgi:monoamine oxidase
MTEPTQRDVRQEFDGGLRDCRPPRRVVVVGAGLAGLATAYELSRRGSEVTVLEASARAGGRAYTLRAPFADGMQVEAGAMTVTPHCHYLMHYVRELGVGLGQADLLGTDFSYFLGGRFVRPDAESLSTAGLDLNPDERRMDVTEMIERYVRAVWDELDPDIRAPEWAATPLLAPFDDRSVHDILRERGASQAAIDLMEPMFLEMRGGDLRSASALAWLRHESSPHSLSHADPGWAKIEGGTDRLPAAFADRLREQIRYGEPVVRVEQDDRVVRATFVDHGRLQTIEADHLVLTVPFSAIRHVDLTDARLSDEKHEVMRRVRYSSMVRVFLQVRRQCWPGTGASFSTDLPIRWVRDATPRATGPRRILECLMTGWRARATAAMSEEERIEFALAGLERMFPDVREHFEVGTSVAWDREPHVEGAYILPEKGHQRLMPAIRRSEGRVHFAGEHTGFEPNGGSMTFALESAARTVVSLGRVDELARSA